MALVLLMAKCVYCQGQGKPRQPVDPYPVGGGVGICWREELQYALFWRSLCSFLCETGCSELFLPIATFCLRIQPSLTWFNVIFSLQWGFGPLKGMALCIVQSFYNTRLGRG